MKRLRERRGYTLIELLTVVMILAILTAIAIPKYQNMVWQAHDTEMGTWVVRIGAANRMYHLDKGNWAYGPLTNACNACACGNTACGGYESCQLVACKYLSTVNWDGLPYMLGAGRTSPDPTCLDHDPTPVASPDNSWSGWDPAACGARRLPATNPYLDNGGCSVDMAGVLFGNCAAANGG